MKEQLAKIKADALSAFERAADAAALDALRVKYLGKKGELTGVLKMMGKLSPEERPVMGQLANDGRSGGRTGRLLGEAGGSGSGTAAEIGGSRRDHSRQTGLPRPPAPHVYCPG